MSPLGRLAVSFTMDALCVGSGASWLCWFSRPLKLRHIPDVRGLLQVHPEPRG
jgi:hypothetical protein